MRFAIVLLFAATAHALRPVPLMVQRRALLGGGAAAFVANGVDNESFVRIGQRIAITPSKRGPD